MLNYKNIVSIIVFITGIVYSVDSFSQGNLQNDSCQQIIQNPQYPMCDEQDLTKYTTCYIDSNKIIPGQTSVGYQSVQGILHDISKEDKEGQVNKKLEKIINFEAPVLLLNRSLIPNEYTIGVGKLPLILLDAHHRTVALKQWQHATDQRRSFCRLIKIQINADINKKLEGKDTQGFWQVLNENNYSNVENVDNFHLDFMKMTDSPVRSLFGISDNGVTSPSSIYPNIMAKIASNVNFKEFIVGKKLLDLINKDEIGANEILNIDEFYSNLATKEECIKEVTFDIKVDTERQMTRHKLPITQEQANLILLNANNTLASIKDMKLIATTWGAKNWQDNSVKYKLLKCYMENLHLHNPALNNALIKLNNLNQKDILGHD